MKNQNRRIIALLLAFVMVFSAVILTQAADPQAGMSEDDAYVEGILTSTLGAKLGMYGFEGEKALVDPDEIVNIIVEFVTPCAAALELGTGRGSAGYDAYASADFEEQAAAAHAAFYDQLGSVGGGARQQLAITAETSTLFNGAFMSVPASLVPEIAALDEVYSVCPDISGSGGADEYYDDLGDGRATGQEIAEYPELLPSGLWPYQNIGHNDEARKSFRIDYINAPVAQGGLGITGKGIKVGVCDSGINLNHEIFQQYKVGGKIQGGNWTPGYTTGMGADNDDLYNHGSHVSGTIIAMAPGIELWMFRCLDSNNSFGGAAQVISACQAAYNSDMDIVSLSLGANNRWDPLSNAYSYMTLNKDIFVSVCCMNNGNSAASVVPDAGVSPYPIYVANSMNASNGAPSNKDGIYGGAGDVNNISTVGGSGRGPAPNNFRTGPNISAPGVLIRSAWKGPSATNYGNFTGTSMATPVISGVAALVFEAFGGHYNATTNPNGIKAAEVKARLMNTARPHTASSTGSSYIQDVFAAGAGYVQPLKAVLGHSYVTTKYNVEMPNSNDLGFVTNTSGVKLNTNWEKVNMADFCFGSVVKHSDSGVFPDAKALIPEGNIITIPATIHNTSNVERTYTLDSYFINPASGTNPVKITLSPKTITVPANSIGTFAASVTANGSVAAINYQGIINVSSGGAVIARMPFCLQNAGYRQANDSSKSALNTSAQNVTAYTLTVDTNGGPFEFDSINVSPNASVLDFMNIKYPGLVNGSLETAEGFKIEGWYLDAGCSQPLTSATTMTGNMTVYADWGGGEPEVFGVTVYPKETVFGPGESYQFNAAVDAKGSVATYPTLKSVNWSISGNTSSGTTVSSTGLVTIGAGETLYNTITVKATSAFDPAFFDTATVIVAPKATAEIIWVKGEPTTPTVVYRGAGYNFAGIIKVRGDGDPTLIWQVSGQNNAGTTISNGVLTVPTAETATSLTVKVTSAADPTKTASFAVTLEDAGGKDYDGQWNFATAVNGSPNATQILNAAASAQPGDIRYFNGGPPAFNSTNFPSGLVIPNGVRLRFNTGSLNISPGVVTYYGNGGMEVSSSNTPAPLTRVETNVTILPAPGAPTPAPTIVPAILDVEIDPVAAEASPGDVLQLVQIVETKHLPIGVTWDLTGALSANTKIIGGLLIVGLDETADKVYVKVTSTADPSKSATATITITDIDPTPVYTVTFLDWNGAVLKAQQVKEGGAAQAPSDPKRPGCVFTGWLPADFSNIVADLNVVAQYEEIPDLPTIVVGNVSGKVGDIVSVPVSLKNNPGVAGMAITVDFNGAVLKLVDCVDAGTLNGPLHSTPLGSSPYTMMWYNPTGVDSMFNGVIATLKFEILAGAGLGVYNIGLTYNPDDIINADMEEVYFGVEPGSVTVIDAAVTYYTVRFLDWKGDEIDVQTVAEGDAAIAPTAPDRPGWTFVGWSADFSNITADLDVTAQYEEEPLPPFLWGDVNDDGEVDMLDSILLSRYIAEWGISINLLAADVNDDGVVDMLDGIIMARHIAEWPGYEVLPVKL